ncbi:MAG TPA: FIST N-terminal domain-containing protein [Tepidisphaeraceae bacterium]|nr:FIST N-terminal domain-containing protein [Tepidisphaeraceae bacterium]
MKFHSVISDLESTPRAKDAIVTELRAALGRIDVAFVFFTAHHSPHSPMLVESLRSELNAKVLIGCSGEGVIGGGAEIERELGISVLAGQMDGVEVHPIRIATDDWRGLLSQPEHFQKQLGIATDTRAVIGFGDPWTTPLNQFMQAMDMLAPRVPLIGGMASAARSAGENVLICDDQTADEGFVGVSLSGALEVETLVSQGARPIGQPMVITRGRDNVIEQLGGKPPMQALEEIFAELPDGDRMLLQHGLLIGRAISEYREEFGRGDFLVRNITGADEKTGSMALTDHIRIGQTVQFHVRDAASADEDLRLMLETAAKSGSFEASLLFSCNGRGSRMFDSPNHDISVSSELLPKTPVAGFFAAGELGPVGGRNFIHGHTASFALLRNEK